MQFKHCRFELMINPNENVFYSDKIILARLQCLSNICSAIVALYTSITFKVNFFIVIMPNAEHQIHLNKFHMSNLWKVTTSIFRPQIIIITNYEYTHIHYIDSSSILPEDEFMAVDDNPKNICISFFSDQTRFDSCLIRTSFILASPCI